VQKHELNIKLELKSGIKKEYAVVQAVEGEKATSS
jgi:hypothetical protein